MKKILVFGGTGAMGVYLVDILSKTGLYEIDVTSRSNRESTLPYLKYIKGNARDNDFMRSYGYDVSLAISKLVDNQDAFGKVIQIASSENMTWREILKLYLDILKEKKNLTPRIYLTDHMQAIDELYEGGI